MYELRNAKTKSYILFVISEFQIKNACFMNIKNRFLKFL